MNRVRLDVEEAKWFLRNVVKTTTLLEAAAKKDPKILERSQYKTLASLVPQVAKAAAGVYADDVQSNGIDIQLDRKQRIVVKHLVDSVNKTLTERIIPEYEKRGDGESMESAKKKSEFLNKLARKFK